MIENRNTITRIKVDEYGTVQFRCRHIIQSVSLVEGNWYITDTSGTWVKTKRGPVLLKIGDVFYHHMFAPNSCWADKVDDHHYAHIKEKRIRHEQKRSELPWYKKMFTCEFDALRNWGWELLDKEPVRGYKFQIRCVECDRLLEVDSVKPDGLWKQDGKVTPVGGYTVITCKCGIENQIIRYPGT